MFPGFDRIVEERIRQAQKEGKFEELPGSGKPLPEEQICVAEDIRLAYKILKNADCLPPELELKKEIKSTQELLSGMEETAEKYKTLQKLNLLIMKLNSCRKSSVAFDAPQEYLGLLSERFGAHASCGQKKKND
jgi:hypothetical protein